MVWCIGAAVALLALASGKELTPENWDAETAGKKVMVKFFAPWCGHCKAMKPDWDKLMTEFEGSTTSGVYDVDCEGTGKDLCQEHDVKGFPTIKHGDPDSLEVYEGDRSFDALKKFADESLGPQCGPLHLDLCSPETKALIESILAMPKAELKAKSEQASERERAFKKRYRKFSAKYKDFEAEEAEEFEQVSMQSAEKAKFEKRREKASKAELAKQEKKDKKAKERAEKFTKRKNAIEGEKEKFEKEKEAIEEEETKAGLKYMRAMLKQSAKEEL